MPRLQSDEGYNQLRLSTTSLRDTPATPGPLGVTPSRVPHFRFLCRSPQVPQGTILSDVYRYLPDEGWEVGTTTHWPNLGHVLIMEQR